MHKAIKDNNRTTKREGISKQVISKVIGRELLRLSKDFKEEQERQKMMSNKLQELNKDLIKFKH